MYYLLSDLVDKPIRLKIDSETTLSISCNILMSLFLRQKFSVSPPYEEGAEKTGLFENLYLS